MHSIHRKIMTISVVAIICTVSALVAWIKTVPTSIDEARMANFPLVLALNAYKQKTGHYPKMIAEIKEVIRTFDPLPFKKYEQGNKECITTMSYCVGSDGEYEINFSAGGPYTVCTFHSKGGLDFICHD